MQPFLSPRPATSASSPPTRSISIGARQYLTARRVPSREGCAGVPQWHLQGPPRIWQRPRGSLLTYYKKIYLSCLTRRVKTKLHTEGHGRSKRIEVTAPATRLHQYRLTTAEIIYHLPDHPSLLQSFVWQQLDIAPEFPKLRRFLDFWAHNIEGKLHSVRVGQASLGGPARFRHIAVSQIRH